MVEVPAQAALREFLEARKGVLTQKSAAQQLGISPVALTYYLQGVSRPKSDLRERIERWSEGAVPASAWLTTEETEELAQQPIAPSPRTSESGEHQAVESPTSSTGTDEG
ncbi:MAG TPA: helix-turn-helix transcriptional regulator [Polyangiaceae bacterium]